MNQEKIKNNGIENTKLKEYIKNKIREIDDKYIDALHLQDNDDIVNYEYFREILYNIDRICTDRNRY